MFLPPSLSHSLCLIFILCSSFFFFFTYIVYFFFPRGIYYRDMSHVMDGNPSKIQKDSGEILINIWKLKLCNKIISDALVFQNVCPLTPLSLPSFYPFPDPLLSFIDFLSPSTHSLLLTPIVCLVGGLPSSLLHIANIHFVSFLSFLLLPLPFSSLLFSLQTKYSFAEDKEMQGYIWQEIISKSYLDHTLFAISVKIEPRGCSRAEVECIFSFSLSLFIYLFSSFSPSLLPPLPVLHLVMNRTKECSRAEVECFFFFSLFVCLLSSFSPPSHLLLPSDLSPYSI